jgi:PAS domain S-box-containing protein
MVSKSVIDREKRIVIRSIVVLLLFTLLCDALIYFQQRQQSLSTAMNQAIHDIQLIDSFVDEALTKGDYVTVKTFLETWASDRDDVLRATLATTNGFVLVHIEKPGPARNPRVFQRRVTYGADGIVDLMVTRDLSAVYEKLHNTLLLLFTTTLALILAVSFLLWRMLQRTVLTPLRTELDEQEALVRLLLDSTAEAIFGVNRDGKCIFANRACVGLLGYDSADELMGQDMQRLTHFGPANGEYTPPTSAENICDIMDEGHGTHSDAEVLVTKGGRRFPVECWSYPIHRGGDVVGAVVTFFDITERKQAEQELHKYREKLEDIIAERTRELEATHEELVRKERLATVGQMAATVSHELRNPLGTIQSTTFLIANRIKNTVPELEKPLQRLERNVARCNNIVTELLDFTRSREPNKQMCNIDDWLRQTLEEIVIPDEIRLETELNTGQNIAFDENLMRRVVVNIIDNAVQAIQSKREAIETPLSDCIIQVQTRADNQHVDISIADNGSGIPAEVSEKIFEPLFSTKSFGVGLGMSIVKEIIERHAGSITIDSAEMQGTRVNIRLPV